MLFFHSLLFLFTDSIGTHLNPLAISVSHHTETSQLVYRASQLTGFYMIPDIGR